MAYNKDTDYQALIHEAAARGDFATAARYEQQRNEKIADLNASGTNKWNAQATNNYSQYLPQDPLANNNVFSQAQGGGMNMSMPSYNPGNLGSRPVYDGSVINANKPTYENQYAERIDALLNDILNREKFSYDAETDPMYQQYKTQYKREGNRAMNDTLATVAAGAGGMNSYAMTAAQQANDYYNAQLADKIPELRQLAYSMYMDDLNSQRMDLSMLQSAEQQDYAKYLDSLGQWNSDRNFGYGVHLDQVADWENDRNFGYNQYRDQMGDYQWGEEFGYQKQQDALDREQWQQEFDYMVQQDALERAAKAYTGGGGPIDDDDDGYDPDDDPEEIDDSEEKVVTNPNGYISQADLTRQNYETKIQGKPISEYEAAAGNYQEMSKMCEEVYSTQGRAAVLEMLTEAYQTGALNWSDYSNLYGKYRNKK